ncbi:surface exclusion protein [Escherichia coli]|uniref:surface exclusion protein n=1 Tax=Escherichia coli TaxID=562 RepID=UPI00278C56E7|nr:surface exclusion protein [Escherichia coli]
MKNLAHIALITVIQFIACYLADWGSAETVFILCFIVLWQGLFIWLFSQIRKKRNVSGEFKFSKAVWYITMPVSALLSPLLSMMIFIIGTLYELRRVCGCVSVREWMQSQVNEKTNEDLHLEFDNAEFHRINPATGLPMSGICVDIGGNPYGYSSKKYDES